jgi:hypothetical protein
VLLAVTAEQRESLQKLGMDKLLAPDAYYASHEAVLNAARKLLAKQHAGPENLIHGVSGAAT